MKQKSSTARRLQAESRGVSLILPFTFVEGDECCKVHGRHYIQV